MSDEELRRRLLFILHRALVEARLLAQANKHEQLMALADTMEPIPGHLQDLERCDLEGIRFSLRTYRTKFPSPSFDYLRYLDVDPVPDRF